MTAAGNTFEVGGEIRRIAIVTVGTESWAAYLAQRLRPIGAEIVVVSQRAYKVTPDSWAFVRRLARRRGLGTAVDNALLLAVRAAARPLTRVLSFARGRLRGGDGTARGEGPPVLTESPSVLRESWIALHEVDDVNGPEGLAVLERTRPDVIVLAGAPIMGRRALATARIGILNSHCGITPEYAGSSPVERAIFERRFDAIGYTVHLVVPTVDGGPVLHQERIAWDPRRPNRHLWPILAQRMYDKLADVVIELASGRRLVATPVEGVRVVPPAGLFVKLIAELRRMRYARRVPTADPRTEGTCGS